MHKRAYSGETCRNPNGSISLTHPNGVTGTYSLEEIKHRMGYAEWTTVTSLRCASNFLTQRTPTYYDIYHQPIETISVTDKTLSGADIPTSQWVYTYESDVDEVRYPVGHQYEGHPIATSGDDPTNWTKVLNPDGSESVYYHYWNILNVSGFDSSFAAKLARMEKNASPSGALLGIIRTDIVSTIQHQRELLLILPMSPIWIIIPMAMAVLAMRAIELSTIAQTLKLISQKMYGVS